MCCHAVSNMWESPSTCTESPSALSADSLLGEAIWHRATPANFATNVLSSYNIIRYLFWYTRYISVFIVWLQLCLHLYRATGGWNRFYQQCHVPPFPANTDVCLSYISTSLSVLVFSHDISLIEYVWNICTKRREKQSLTPPPSPQYPNILKWIVNYLLIMLFKFVFPWIVEKEYICNVGNISLQSSKPQHSICT